MENEKNMQKNIESIVFFKKYLINFVSVNFEV